MSPGSLKNVIKSAKINNLSLKIIVDANLRLDDILDEFKCDFVWDYNTDLRTQYIVFKEEPNLDFKYFANSYEFFIL